MASDGEHFRVAVLKGDDKYKRFVKGTNSADYGKFDADGESTLNKPTSRKRRKKQSARFRICVRNI